MTDIKWIEGSLIGKKYKPDMEFKFTLAIPQAQVEEYALFVEHDWIEEANINSLLKLADEGKAPYCVSICVLWGNLLLPDGNKRGMRMNNYDMFDREYGDFVVYELIPYIEKKYDIRFSQSPDMHFVSGGSSGGISAFNIAWFHSDYFHRVFMSSPSFLAMGRGNEIPYLIRKFETKPLRIYEEYSENEPNDYFGWSRAIDEEVREALTFANYDFSYGYFAGEGHCSRYRVEEEAYKRNEWIWRDWETNGIEVKAHSPRVSKVIPITSKWEFCEQFPIVEQPVPTFLAEMYDTVVLSNDGLVWYAANKNDDLVYLHINDDAISADRRVVHAMLHSIPKQSIRGVIDMVVDKTDRLFVLTEMGVQCVRSFGLIDTILELPDDVTPQKIAVTDGLYVQTAKGVYKRELCADCITEGEEKRKCVDYYD